MPSHAAQTPVSLQKLHLAITQAIIPSMETDPDPKDYLAMLALGLGPAGQPHVWEVPRRMSVSGDLIWACKFCSAPYAIAKADEPCPEHPPGIARPGG